MHPIRISFVAAAAACSTACGAAPPPDPLPAHLARVPIDAESVGQIDVAKVIDIEEVDAWIGRMAGALGRPADPCLLDAVRRTTHVTVADFRTASGRSSEEGAIVAGDLRARDLGTCLAAAIPWATEAGPMTVSGDGRRVTLGDPDAPLAFADLPDGPGVVVGSEEGVEMLLADRPPEASFAAQPLLGRLRSLTGGGDFEIFLAPRHGEGLFDLPLAGAGLALRRGAPDRYTAILLAASAVEARMLSMGVGAMIGLVAERAADMVAGLDEGGEDPAPAWLLESAPKLRAVAVAAAAAAVEAEGDAVRVTIELDPAAVSPTSFIGLAGAWLWAGTARRGVPEPPGNPVIP
ncbi:MAG: hypothetical protein QME96_15405 [Myxococcota bacterium]|nr:hypothetical protein [Myxococcota bacterium]